ncbi:uncharacterized protein LOC117648505 [Thrips palmi]|uniref:Uncharacterized protein LOC117648505 n=1 Tax=Thrips palmi TaxID=161013 RepID=A0A6P8ZCY0_THRPL|nr:uncharacterized protein LOC117648505 [Thrips palmi]
MFVPLALEGEVLVRSCGHAILVVKPRCLSLDKVSRCLSMAGIKRCAIKLCKNTSEDGFSMITVTERRRTKLNWLTLCDLPESTPKHSYICEGHFTKDQTEIIDIYDGTRLKSNAVPTILSPNPPKLFVKQTVGTYIVEGVDEKGNHILKLDPDEPFRQVKLLKSSPVKDASTPEPVVPSTASEHTPATETPSINAQETLHSQTCIDFSCLAIKVFVQT